MKAVILAGGYGTRMGTDTDSIPKPMVEIGGRPILWHIMKYYSCWGINEFIICLGYKGYIIKEFFSNYAMHMTDVSFDIKTQKMTLLHQPEEDWHVQLIDTGSASMTGGRLKRIKKYVGDETFCMTYGDGLSNVDIGSLVKFHEDHSGLVTVTSVSPPGRFGVLEIENDSVSGIIEKPETLDALINGGFFVLDPAALDLITDDGTVWESETMPLLAQAGQLRARNHKGFWMPMDTPRERSLLDELWVTGRAPWKIW